MSNKKHRNDEKKNKPKLKILWSSNGVNTSSGYGNQSRHILYRMLEAGYDVKMQAFYGVQGGKVTADGLDIYPRMNMPWGEDGLIKHGQDMQADVVFTFQDIWPLDIKALSQVNYWIPYVPIDCFPLSEHVKARLNVASEIVTHSKFGRDLLRKNGFSSTYIPLTTDTKVMQPRDQKEAREMFKLPQDKFIFGMVAANKDNPSRKSFQEVIDAFSEVNIKYPDTILYLHTNLMDGGGFPVMEYCAYKGLQGKVFMLDPYTMQYKLDHKALSYLFSSFDCLLNPSSSEGFGVGIVEAQACGVPVIVNNCTSMPELVGAGEICETGYKRWNFMASYNEHPDPKSLQEKMESLYTRITGGEREALKKKAVEFAQDYDSDTVFKKYWLPYLQRLEKRRLK